MPLTRVRPTAARDKIDHSLFCPIPLPVGSPTNKAYMTSLGRGFQEQMGMRLGQFSWKTFWSQKGVVLGIQQQRRHLNRVDESNRRASSPVVLGISESVERSRKGVVKIPKCAAGLIRIPWNGVTKFFPKNGHSTSHGAEESQAIKITIGGVHSTG